MNQRQIPSRRSFWGHSRRGLHQRKMLLPLKEIDETPFGLLFRNLQRCSI